MYLMKFLLLSCFHRLAMTNWINENVTDSQLFEGDIEGVPQTDNDGDYTDEFHAPFSWNYDLWPNGTVPYAFNPYSTDFSTLQKEHIESVMRELSSRTCIKFIPVPNENVYHVLIKHSQTCSSKVGRIKNSNERWQILRLDHRCVNRNDILHELMHVLGFLHEHNRPDRDEYVTINWENIIDGKNGSFQKQPSLHVTNVNKPYDYASITHYPSTGSSKNRKETITPKRSGVQIKADGLSDMDVEKINELYDCAKETKFTSSTQRPAELTTKSTSTEDDFFCYNCMTPVTNLKQQNRVVIEVWKFILKQLPTSVTEVCGNDNNTLLLPNQTCPDQSCFKYVLDDNSDSDRGSPFVMRFCTNQFSNLKTINQTEGCLSEMINEVNGNAITCFCKSNLCNT